MRFAKQLPDRNFLFYILNFQFVKLSLFCEWKLNSVVVVIKHHCQHTAVIAQLVCRTVYCQVNGGSVECVGWITRNSCECNRAVTAVLEIKTKLVLDSSKLAVWNCFTVCLCCCRYPLADYFGISVASASAENWCENKHAQHKAHNPDFHIIHTLEFVCSSYSVYFTILRFIRQTLNVIKLKLYATFYLRIIDKSTHKWDNKKVYELGLSEQ